MQTTVIATKTKFEKNKNEQIQSLEAASQGAQPPKNKDFHWYLTPKVIFLLQDLEDEMAQSVTNGSLSKKDFSKLASNLKKDFPQGIPKCGADALRFGLTWNDISSK